MALGARPPAPPMMGAHGLLPPLPFLSELKEREGAARIHLPGPIPRAEPAGKRWGQLAGDQGSFENFLGPRGCNWSLPEI